MVGFVVQSGPSEGQRIDVDRELVLGRENADVTLEDSEISRRHAVVRPTASGLEIEDLGSTNGTHVDGTRIEVATVVGDGATIRLGTTTIVVEGPAPVASAAGATVVSDLAPATAVRATADAEPSAPPPAEPVAAHAEAFGTFRSSPARRRRAATRLFVPMLLTYAAVGATAAALIVYFLLR